MDHFPHLREEVAYKSHGGGMAQTLVYNKFVSDNQAEEVVRGQDRVDQFNVILKLEDMVDLASVRLYFLMVICHFHASNWETS